ncbi:uncharacterized protein LOC108600773 [Drosophila busckii]|uniref:uncharacterized protein LOC108600773 n=1 Tax=Drosophila busckii TaxID=30019 RepID=UPI00143341E2|nr:uncharacterized protein LOC108600773 [Drosophila busckii]
MATSLSLLLPLLLSSLGQPTTADVMDNVNDGLKLAGQMFGINTAADVANLVAKAFSRVATSKKPADLLNTFQQGFGAQQNEPAEDQSEQQSDPENAQETPPVDEAPRRRPAEFSSVQMLSNIMRMIGFDPRKLGALALNAIVMIAQAIGSTIMQATANRDTGPEAIFEPIEHQPRAFNSDNPIDWFMQRPSTHTQRMLRRIMDRQLPEHIVDMIEAKENADQGGNEAACLKLLMCKSTPIIWGMQDSLKKRLAGEPEKLDESAYFNANGFFKYLPSLDEFRQHSQGCEARFAQHCHRNETLGRA